MAILAFQKPDKVIMLESTDKFGKFEFRPLEPGYGITIGNPLRRILLSSLEGFAITGIKIHGVEHEFATIPGVIEDVTEIILNLKQVRFKRKVEDVEDEKLTVLINGQEAFKAGDINKFLTGFEVLNTELVICHMDPSVNFQMEITIQKGRGYVPSTENMPAEAEAGFIPIDAIYTPIRNVKYEIENYRVEGKTDYEKLTVTVSGQETFTAGDMNQFLKGFEVLNPELVICNMDTSTSLSMELTIQKGRGYVPASENMPADAEIGVIPIDAIYTPIKNVKYEIENYRVEGKTDYERLVFDIETDGSINPTDALKEAAKILIHHFMLFSDEKITLETEDKYGNEEFDEEVLHMRQLLKTKLVDMDLSVRALNCLKSAEVETLGELVQFNKNDLLKFRNFGKKSLTELEALLENNNLEFGMDVAKYKLDKE